jgi:anti-sigma factor RsiW
VKTTETRRRGGTPEAGEDRTRPGCDEGDLALYVEGDLTPEQERATESHLRGCLTCRAFLVELRASQAALHDLADEPVDDAGLASFGSRVAAATATKGPSVVGAGWWTVAASLVVAAAGAILWLAAPVVHAPHAPRVAALPVAAPTLHQAAPASRPAEVPVTAPEGRPKRPRSTVRVPRAVSHGMDQPAPVPTLSPDDADQLARAVVAISRIRSVEEALREAPPPDPDATPLVRLATADPNVVIYWRLEPKGEE